MNEYFNNEFDSTDIELEDGTVIKDVTCSGKDFTIGSIMQLWEDGDIKVPDFQRNYVWKIEQASKFIESLMLGLPIPSLMFYQDSQSYLLIIDRQQRIKTILLFSGKIDINNLSKYEKSLYKFKLTGLSPESPFYNRKYEDFSVDEIRSFKSLTSLYINLIKLKDPNNLTSIYRIFERLNTGGTLLTAQEIRNCIFSGEFNNFIIKLNEYENWKKFITNKSSESHQQDVELILRFFALYDMKFPYKRPMKDYLSNYMQKVRHMTEQERNEKEKLFKAVVDKIYKHLGTTPFHIKKGLNSAVLDSVMIAFAKNIDNIPNNISKKYQELCSDEEYYKYCGKNANDIESVKNRLQMANDYLFGKVEKIEQKSICLYDLPVSAGMGNFLNDENISYSKIKTSNRKADFALKISGDSMEPEIPNGSVVLVKKQNTINSGQIGIFNYDDMIRCKKFIKNKKHISLLSTNKKYPPLNISSNRKFEIIGVVLEFYKDLSNV